MFVKSIPDLFCKTTTAEVPIIAYHYKIKLFPFFTMQQTKYLGNKEHTSIIQCHKYHTIMSPVIVTNIKVQLHIRAIMVPYI